MVQINKVEANHDYVMVEYITNGMTISTRVYHHDELTPQEIIAKGYEELKPHIQMECDRLGIVADHTLPTVTDEVLSIELLGVENLNFTEGQTPIEKSLRCKGNTLYGKAINLTDVATFLPPNPMVLTPSATETVTVNAYYNGLTATGEFTVYYKSLADIALEEEERKKQEAEMEKQRVIAEKKARMEAIKVELQQTDYKAIKYAEGCYTDAEYAPTKLMRDNLRSEYNELEIELETAPEYLPE